MTEVKEGQIWRPNDPRDAGREFVIYTSYRGGAYVVVRCTKPADRIVAKGGTTVGRYTYILRKSFKLAGKRGYTLVKDV